jgi:hypothetical protein
MSSSLYKRTRKVNQGTHKIAIDGSKWFLKERIDSAQITTTYNLPQKHLGFIKLYTAYLTMIEMVINEFEKVEIKKSDPDLH